MFSIQAEIRKEFAKLDTDSSGFITKGNALKTQNIFPTNLFFRGNGGNNCLRIYWRQGLANSNTFFFLLFMFSCQLSEAQAAIDKLDVDKDGKVSYPEFILVMKYKK